MKQKQKRTLRTKLAKELLFEYRILVKMNAKKMIPETPIVLLHMLNRVFDKLRENGIDFNSNT